MVIREFGIYALRFAASRISLASGLTRLDPTHDQSSFVSIESLEKMEKSFVCSRYEKRYRVIW